MPDNILTEAWFTWYHICRSCRKWWTLQVHAWWECSCCVRSLFCTFFWQHYTVQNRHVLTDVVQYVSVLCCQKNVQNSERTQHEHSHHAPAHSFTTRTSKKWCAAPWNARRNQTMDIFSDLEKCRIHNVKLPDYQIVSRNKKNPPTPRVHLQRSPLPTRSAYGISGESSFSQNIIWHDDLRDRERNS
jgi:hypothetical protein